MKRSIKNIIHTARNVEVENFRENFPQTNQIKSWHRIGIVDNPSYDGLREEEIWNKHFFDAVKARMATLN